MEQDVAGQEILPREGEPKEEVQQDYCEGEVEATESHVDRDRNKARAEARKLARASADAVCAERRCMEGRCKLRVKREIIRVHPTQEIDAPRTYTAEVTIIGRCAC